MMLKSCVSPLCDWYRDNHRPFPWRLNPEPYAVWLSEIMLQQTRIEAALPYYDRFLQTLPDIASLASASEDTILKLWEGLGYYSRARNMQKAAQVIMEQHGGEFPNAYEDIVALPGIGDYTAGAIASICFGTPVPAVDGNVLRVLARLTENYDDVMLPATKKKAVAIMRDLLTLANHPGDLNQGIMELGERICLPNGIPLCADCPLNAYCKAHQNGTVTELPVRTVKTKRRIEHRTLFICITNEATPRLLIQKRPDNGLLAGLWELPSVDGTLSPEDAAVWVANRAGIDTNPVPVEQLVGKHIFSHLEWRMTAYLFRTDVYSLPSPHLWVSGRELTQTYALPSAFRSFFETINTTLKEDVQ